MKYGVTYSWWTGFHNQTKNVTKTFDTEQERDDYVEGLKLDGGTTIEYVWQGDKP